MSSPGHPAKKTVYFIRHGEKPSSGANGLNAQGIQRAQYLRQHFGPESEYNIGYILAQRPKKDGRQARPYETVKPLAADLVLTVDTDCGRDDFEGFVKKVQDYKGKGNVLVCWEHKRLTDLAKALGVRDPPRYPTERFDLIWTCEEPYHAVVEGRMVCPGLDGT